MRAMSGNTDGHSPRRWGRVMAGGLLSAILLLSGCGSSLPGISQLTEAASSRLAAAGSAAASGTAAVGAAETGASASSAIGTTDTAGSARPVVSARTGGSTSATAATTRAVTTTGGKARSAASNTSGTTVVAPGGFGNVDACKLVTKAEASTLLGGPARVSVVGDSVSDGSFSQSCMYSLGAGAVGSALGVLGAATPQSGGERSANMIVEIYPASGASWFKHDQGTVQTGIGDQYFLKGVGRAGNTQSGGITVLKGDAAVGISVLTDPSKALSAEQYREMGRKAVSRLPEQTSGPAPAPPKFVPGTPTAVPPPAAPTAAIPAMPTPSPAVKAVTASIQAALKAAQAGDLAKARAAYAPVAQQWAAIPNDGKLATPELYAAVTAGIKQTDDVMASTDTDAPAAASALSDLADAVDAALASAPAMALAAAMAPQLAAFGTAGAGMATPIAESADQNGACALITKAEADAVLGGSSEVQTLPSFDSSVRSCRFVLLSTPKSNSNTTSSMTCTTMTAGGTSCVGTASVDMTKIGLISLELHLTGGRNWYAENEQHMNDYRSGADIGDQFYATGALAIWVLKGDQAFSITMPPFTDFTGTPIAEMKGLAAKAASRLH